MWSIRHWLQAARPLAQANLAAPLLFGEALAYQVHSRFRWELVVAVALWGVLDQLFIVFANDYADRDHDRGGSDKTPFSGGSGVIPEGKIPPLSLKRAALGAYLLLGVLSIVLALVGTLWMIALWAMAGVLLWLYSYPPVRLSYSGGGEWLQALGVGGVLPLVGFAAQAETLDRFPWPVLAATLTLGFAGNVATSLPDLNADRRANKRTWAVRYGRARAAWACTGLTAVGIYLAIMAGASGAVAFAALLLLPNVFSGGFLRNLKATRVPPPSPSATHSRRTSKTSSIESFAPAAALDSRRLRRLRVLTLRLRLHWLAAPQKTFGGNLRLADFLFDPRSRTHAVRFVFFQGATTQALLLTWAWFASGLS